MNIITISNQIKFKMKNKLQHIAETWPDHITGTLLQNKIKVYWFQKVVNFGDLITPLILKKSGFTPIHCNRNLSTILLCGSVLQHVSEDYSGYILGSGLIRDCTRYLNKAKILGVRGELTRERVGASKEVVLGDPGLLASIFLKHRPQKSHSLGIVSHYVDKGDPRVLKIQKRYKKEVKVIDVQQDPLTVFTEIAKCEHIISSSLHGLVVADSLGIPNGWILLSDQVVGKGFKFADYNSALGTKQNPLFLSGDENLMDLLQHTRKSPESVKEIKEKLKFMFANLKNYVTTTSFD